MNIASLEQGLMAPLARPEAKLSDNTEALKIAFDTLDGFRSSQLTPQDALSAMQLSTSLKREALSACKSLPATAAELKNATDAGNLVAFKLSYAMATAGMIDAVVYHHWNMIHQIPTVDSHPVSDSIAQRLQSQKGNHLWAAQHSDSARFVRTAIEFGMRTAVSTPSEFVALAESAYAYGAHAAFAQPMAVVLAEH